MKSVGEVMAIGRTFPEALQKAVRMLDIGVRGVDPHAFAFPDLRRELRFATPRRLFAIARALQDGMSIDEIHDLTRVDAWFLREVGEIVTHHDRLAAASQPLDPALIRESKQLGFSDLMIDELTQRAARHHAGRAAWRRGFGPSSCGSTRRRRSFPRSRTICTRRTTPRCRTRRRPIGGRC